MFRGKRIRVLILSLLLGLLGCAFVPLIEQSARATPDAVAQRLDAQPPQAGMGQVVVYRSRSVAVPGKVLALQVNGQNVGGLGSETYLRLSLSPGEHSFTAAATTQWQASTRLRVAAGETSFVHFDLRRYPTNLMVGNILVRTPSDGGAFLRATPRAEALQDLVGMAEVDRQAQVAAAANAGSPQAERRAP